MNIDNKKLKNFKDMKNEMKIIENRIKKLEEDAPGRTSLINMLKNRKNGVHSEIEEIKMFIDNLEDKEIKKIIELRYVEGMSWNKVASKVYGYPNGDTPRVKVDRFLKKNKKLSVLSAV